MDQRAIALLVGLWVCGGIFGGSRFLWLAAQRRIIYDPVGVFGVAILADVIGGSVPVFFEMLLTGKVNLHTTTRIASIFCGIILLVLVLVVMRARPGWPRRARETPPRRA